MLQFASLVCKIHTFNPIPPHFVSKGDKKAFSSLTKAALLLKKKILQLKKSSLPLSKQSIYDFIYTSYIYTLWGISTSVWISIDKFLLEFKINLITTKKSLYQHPLFLPSKIPQI